MSAEDAIAAHEAAAAEAAESALARRVVMVRIRDKHEMWVNDRLWRAGQKCGVEGRQYNHKRMAVVRTPGQDDPEALERDLAALEKAIHSPPPDVSDAASSHNVALALSRMAETQATLAEGQKQMSAAVERLAGVLDRASKPPDRKR